jgi:hypothetical protein
MTRKFRFALLPQGVGEADGNTAGRKKPQRVVADPLR